MSSRRPTRSQSRQPDASLPSIPSTITRRQRRPAMPASATPRASIAAVSRERARLSLGDATPTPTTSTTNTITTITKRRHSLLSPHFDPRSLPTRVGPVRPSAEFALRALLQVGTVTDGQESVLDDAKLEICKGFEDTRHTYLSPTRLFFKPIPTEPDIVNSTFVLSNLTTFLFLVLSSSDRTDESSQDLLRAASGFWVYVWSIAAEGDVDYDEEDGIRLLVAILRQAYLASTSPSFQFPVLRTLIPTTHEATISPHLQSLYNSLIVSTTSEIAAVGADKAVLGTSTGWRWRDVVDGVRECVERRARGGREGSVVSVDEVSLGSEVGDSEREVSQDESSEQEEEEEDEEAEGLLQSMDQPRVDTDTLVAEALGARSRQGLPTPRAVQPQGDVDRDSGSGSGEESQEGQEEDVFTNAEEGSLPTEEDDRRWETDQERLQEQQKAAQADEHDVDEEEQDQLASDLESQVAADEEANVANTGLNEMSIAERGRQFRALLGSDDDDSDSESDEDEEEESEEAVRPRMKEESHISDSQESQEGGEGGVDTQETPMSRNRREFVAPFVPEEETSDSEGEDEHERVILPSAVPQENAPLSTQSGQHSKSQSQSQPQAPPRNRPPPQQRGKIRIAKDNRLYLEDPKEQKKKSFLNPEQKGERIGWDDSQSQPSPVASTSSALPPFQATEKKQKKVNKASMVPQVIISIPQRQEASSAAQPAHPIAGPSASAKSGKPTPPVPQPEISRSRPLFRQDSPPVVDDSQLGVTHDEERGLGGDAFDFDPNQDFGGGGAEFEMVEEGGRARWIGSEDDDSELEEGWEKKSKNKGKGRAPRSLSPKRMRQPTDEDGYGTASSSSEDDVPKTKEKKKKDTFNKYQPTSRKRKAASSDDSHTDSDDDDDDDTGRFRSKEAREELAKKIRRKKKIAKVERKLQKLQETGLDTPTDTSSSESDVEETRGPAKKQSRNPYRQDRNLTGRVRWSQKEDEALVAGLKSFGCNWQRMIDLYGPRGSANRVLRYRNAMSLKDRARNMKQSYITAGYGIPEYMNSVTVKGKFAEMLKLREKKQ